MHSPWNLSGGNAGAAPSAAHAAVLALWLLLLFYLIGDIAGVMLLSPGRLALGRGAVRVSVALSEFENQGDSATA